MWCIGLALLCHLMPCRCIAWAAAARTGRQQGHLRLMLLLDSWQLGMLVSAAALYVGGFSDCTSY